MPASIYDDDGKKRKTVKSMKLKDSLKKLKEKD